MKRIITQMIEGNEFVKVKSCKGKKGKNYNGNLVKLRKRREKMLMKKHQLNLEIKDYEKMTSFARDTIFRNIEELSIEIEKINKEQRNSKNYVLFLGATGEETNQAPCLSLVQFQIDNGELVISAYQRSSDANLGLPADIYHLYLISRQISLPLKSITLFLGNVHIYNNNIEASQSLIEGNNNIKFGLNV